MKEQPNLFPQDNRAEEALLGAILADNDIMPEVDAAITPEDFYTESNRLIYETCLTLYRRKSAIDFVTVTTEMERHEGDELGRAGGIAHITALNKFGKVRNWRTYMKSLQRCTAERKIVRIAPLLADVKHQEDLNGFLSDIQSQLTSIMVRGDTRSTDAEQLASEHLDWVNERLAGSHTIPTGFGRLDAIIDGFQQGDLVIVAARPSMGKTAFVLNLASKACKSGRGVAIFSLEMGRMQLMSRLVASEQAIPIRRILHPRPDDDEAIKRVVAGNEEISKWPLVINDQSAMTVAEIRAECQRLKAWGKLDMVMIDYLQLIGESGKAENRTQEVSKMTRGLKALAKDLNVPVVLLSQLSRAPETRKDKKPMLSDLRESGSIEQDADIAMLLYRAEYYEPEKEQNILTVMVAKNRNGATGDARLYFDKEIQRMRTLNDIAY